MLLQLSIAIFVGSAQSSAPAAPPTPAQLAFGHLNRLTGTWSATSTKGWTEQVTFKTIAAESAVVETSLNAHPNETMTTVFHMDGTRLLLTHYCVAMSQPRLMATSFADGGRTVTFTFLDATNLPTHDHGHMDKVVYRFIDDDHMTSQWTWFAQGKEQWMEEVTATRARDAKR